MTEVKCPKCDSRELKPLKTWELKPKKEYAQSRRISHTVTVTVQLCRNCGKRFKTYRKG